MAAKIKRPLRVTILALALLWLPIGNGMRLGWAIYFWKTLETYQARPLYIAVSGGFWLAASLAMFWGLWSGKAWGWYTAVAGVAGYAAWYWLDRLILQEPHANWPFALGITACLLPITAIILFTSRTRRYFLRKTDE